MMPNPKLGTVTKDVTRAVKSAKAGAVQFRVDKTGIIRAAVGKVTFDDDKLLENLRSFMIAVGDAKPETLKGKYIMSVHMSSTMGPGIPIETASVDPTNPRFMINPTKL